MRTTIDIPKYELADAMRFLNTKSQREAVVTALRDFNRRERMGRLVRFSGTCDFVDDEAAEASESAEAGTRT